MATVTLFNAQRMQAIEDGTIVSGLVDTNGHLILSRHDTTTVDAGKVLAPNLAQATTDVSGIVELATTAETVTGTDATRAVTPQGLTGAITAAKPPAATTTVSGILQLSTSAEAIAGTDTTTAVTPKALDDTLNTVVVPATSSVAGIIQKATYDEVQGGTDDTTAVTPLGMSYLTVGNAITAGDNLNSYTISGHYLGPAQASATLPLNFPVDQESGLLIVETKGVSSFINQTFITRPGYGTSAAPSRIFQRANYNGVGWSAWIEFGSPAGWLPVTPSSVGVAGTSPSATIKANGLVSFSNCSALTFNGVYSQGFKRFKHYILTNTAPGQYVWYRFTSGGSATSAASFYKGTWYRQASSVTFADVTNGATDMRVGYLSGDLDSEIDVIYPYHPTTNPKIRGRFQYSSTNHTDVLTAAMWNAPGGPAAANFDGFRLASDSGGLFSGEVYTLGLLT